MLLEDLRERSAHLVPHCASVAGVILHVKVHVFKRVSVCDL
jgi:hypothetical protein